MDKLETLLEISINEVVNAAACADISKATLVVSGSELGSRLQVAVMRCGNVVEAHIYDKRDCFGTDPARLASELAAHCKQYCLDDSGGGRGEFEALLTANCYDLNRFNPATVLSFQGDSLSFRQMPFEHLELLGNAICIIQDKLREGEIRSARLLVNDGQKHWTLCLSGNTVYSNDFDLFVGAPPSFDFSGAESALRAQSTAFLAERFVKAEWLLARIQFDSANGNRIDDMQADSRMGVNFAEVEIFDLPV